MSSFGFDSTTDDVLDGRRSHRRQRRDHRHLGRTRGRDGSRRGRPRCHRGRGRPRPGQGPRATSMTVGRHRGRPVPGRPGLAGVDPGLHRHLLRRRPRPDRRADRQRRHHGLPAGHHRRRVRAAVRHQPPRPLRAGQPADAAAAHRLAGPGGHALVRRPPPQRREPRRPRVRAHALRRLGGLRPGQDGQRPVRGRARPAAARSRAAGRRRPSRRHHHRPGAPPHRGDDERAHRDSRRAALRVEDGAAGRGHVGVGRVRRRRRRDRRSLLRGLRGGAGDRRPERLTRGHGLRPRSPTPPPRCGPGRRSWWARPSTP